MSSIVPKKEDVLTAAAAIVEAFAATDTERYFGQFAKDASFILHPTPDLLATEDYKRLWQSWLNEGWRVAECQSSNRRVQVFPGVAVFTHDVWTRVEVGDGTQEAYRERETIVFRRENVSLVAIHEHLSPA